MKTIVIVILIFLPLLICAQFNERTIVQKKPKSVTYDTTHNFIHHKNIGDYKMYVDQEFYFLPMNNNYYQSPDERNRFQYFNYLTNRKSSKKGKKSNESHKMSDYRYKHSSYDSIGGKIFKVIDFDESNSTIITDGNNQLCFTLFDETSKDTVIWNPSIYEFYYPYGIVILSYINKLKSKYIGKELIARGEMKGAIEKPYLPPYYGHLININNGDVVNVSELESWKCIDVSIVDIYSKPFKEPMLILRNSKNVEIGVFLLPEASDISRPAIGIDFVIKQEFEEWCKIYGEEYGNLIMLHKVKVGMPSSLCRLSWGNPIEINKTTGNYGVHEQWVYSKDSFLYFENELLTTIQD